MSETLKYILTLVAGGILLAVLNFIKGLLTIKSDTQKSEAQADLAMKSVEEKTIENTKKILDNSNEYIDLLKKDMTETRDRLGRLEKRFDITDKKLNQKRVSIQKAHKCHIPDVDCPVLISEEQFNEDKLCEVCTKVDNQ